MEQTRNGISDERLAKLAKLDCPAAHWGDFQCHLCERRKMARELAALRASHKRLVELLTPTCAVAQNAPRDGSTIVLRFLPQTIRQWEAALAEARKLEGK